MDNDDVLDERDLFCGDDEGDAQSEDYPFLSEYQQERFQELITDVEFAYEESPIEDATPDNQKDVEAAEKRLFEYVGLLLAVKDERIAQLEARQITPEMVHVAQMLIDGATSDEIALYLPLLLSAIIAREDAS